jgi:hypothetical protein
MKKAVLAIAAAATIAAATMTAPTTADARCRGCGVGIAAGILGAAAVGAIIASQPRGGYVEYEGYDRPYPYRCRHGYWARQRLYDRYGEFVGWSDPHFVCRNRY